MSFSKDTKQELCKAEILTDEQRTALIYGMLLFSRPFSALSITLTTECRHAAMLYSELLSSYEGVIVDVNVNLTRRRGNSRIYTVSIPDRSDCAMLFDKFGHSSRQLSLRINRANIDSDDCIACFLRGVFIACGNVTDPEKDYHLEFVVPHKNLAGDLERIISEVEEINTEPGVINRKGSYIVYIKGSENIADMLTYIGAPMSSLNIMQSKIIKSVRNNVNRKINSETANSNKTALASARQINAIRQIQKHGLFDSLPDELRELAEIRLEYPEYNLRELGDALTPPITRSGVNHRLQRLLLIAEGLLSEK